MIKKYKIIAGIFMVFIVASCVTTEKSVQYESLADKIIIGSGSELELVFNKGKAFNHPTFVIWTEDLDGSFLKTIFITDSYASGIFGHELIGDSVWMPTPGPSFQPAALPYWTHKKGLIDGKNLIPTPENPYVDAYTGATPSGSFRFVTEVPQKKYRLLVEINQTWDWNTYWTNNKYPENEAYKHSAQPSLIYAVTINSSDTLFFLNPIGHGNPKGEDGRLFTDLGSITTAKEIFSTIKATLKTSK